LGYLHRKLGNHEIAIQHYKQAIALKPDYADAYFFMGISYATLELYTEAIGAYKQAIAVQPDYTKAYDFMGDACWLRGVKGPKKKQSEVIAFYEQAIAAYKQAIAIDPEYARAYYGMGWAYRDLEKHSEAIEAFKKAIALKPDHAGAYFHMGWCYEKLGQPYEAISIRAAAIAAYQESLRLEPTGFFADFARDGIRRLGGQVGAAGEAPPMVRPEGPASTAVDAEAQTRLYLAKSYRSVERTGRALGILRSVITDFPNTDAAKQAEWEIKMWVSLAKSYRSVGMTGKALEILRSVIMYFPNTDAGKQAEQEIKELEDETKKGGKDS
jgi:tetratricopeptide (TPR) repeat protein